MNDAADPTGVAGLLAEARAAAAPRATPERPLAEGGPAACRAALLAEIGQTILPRLLTFTLADRQLMVEARGRDAAILAGAEPEALWRDERGVFETEDPDPDAQAAALAAVLARFAGPGGALAVRSAPSLLPPSFLGAGHPPEALAARMPEAEADAPPDSAADGAAAEEGAGASADDTTLFAAAARAGLAAARTDPAGRIADATGAGADLAGAAALVARQLAAHDGFADAAQPGPRLVWLGPGAEGGPGVCYAADAGGVALARAEASALRGLLAAWRRSLDDA